MLSILAFRIKLFPGDTSFAGNTENCQKEFTGGTENHQHNSFAGNTENCQNESTGGMKNHQHDSSTGDAGNFQYKSLTHGMKNHQDDSGFDDIEKYPSNVSVGNVKDRLLNAGCFLVLHWQLVSVKAIVIVFVIWQFLPLVLGLLNA